MSGVPGASIAMAVGARAKTVTGTFTLRSDSAGWGWDMSGVRREEGRECVCWGRCFGARLPVIPGNSLQTMARPHCVRATQRCYRMHIVQGYQGGSDERCPVVYRRVQVCVEGLANLETIYKKKQ